MKAVYDSCVYIDFLRSGKYADLFYDRAVFRFLCPVVVMELRAGANDARKIHDLDCLFRPYSDANRIISISANMYLKAGEIIQKISRTFGGISPGLSHDALIAISAASIGARVHTSNAKGYEKIAKFLPMDLQLV
jgi:predicted nucleic acid-binding protein